MNTQSVLTDRDARRLLNIVWELGQENGVDLAIAVVDQGGHLLSFRRSDKTFIGAIEASIAKAMTANAYRRPSAEMQERLERGKLCYLALAGTLPMEGGEPVLLGTESLGAIGVSGAPSSTDAAIARRAVHLFMEEFRSDVSPNT